MATDIKLLQLQQNIEPHLIGIEKLLPKEYKLTLLARHTTMDNADIVLTIDELPKAIEALDRLSKQQ